MSGHQKAVALLRQVLARELTASEAVRVIDTERFESVDWRGAPYEEAYHHLRHIVADEDIGEEDPAMRDAPQFTVCVTLAVLPL